MSFCAMYLQLPLSHDSVDDGWDSDPEDGGEVVVFQPSGLNVSTYDHFAQSDQRKTSIGPGGRMMSKNTIAVPEGLLIESPQGLLFVAAYANIPELYVPVPDRKRLRGKQDAHMLKLGLCLGRLQANPLEDSGFLCDAKGRKGGHREYARHFGLYTGQCCRMARVSTRTSYGNSSHHIKNNWSLLHEVAKVMYERTPQGLNLRGVAGEPLCQAGPEHVIAGQGTEKYQCHSALLTWHSDLGLDDLDIASAVDCGVTADELEALMVKKVSYNLMFEDFVDHVQKMSSVAGAKSWAAGLEHCRNGDHAARVHFHAFVGGAPSFTRDNGRLPEYLLINMSFLTFGGFNAHVRFTRLRGRPGKQATESACQGVYYIMAPKIGQLFNRSMHLPFLDFLGIFIFGVCNREHKLWPRAHRAQPRGAIIWSFFWPIA